jgi:hypothetical protein
MAVDASLAADSKRLTVHDVKFVWNTRADQLNMLRALNAIIWLGVRPGPFRSVRNLIESADGGRTPSMMSRLYVDEEPLSDFCAHYRYDLLDVMNMIPDEDLPFLFFVRLLDVCREHCYDPEDKEILWNPEGDTVSADFRTALERAHIDLPSLLAANCLKDANEWKQINQFRNRVVYGSPPRDRQRLKDAVNNHPYEDLQSAVQLVRDMGVSERLINSAMSECEGVKNVPQLLHIVNSARFKIRPRLNIETKANNARIFLRECPSLLELPDILRRFARDGRLHTRPRGGDVELADFHLIYEEMMRALRAYVTPSTEAESAHS